MDSHSKTEHRTAAWETRARPVLSWRDGEPVLPVLEALALAVALETTGDLPLVPQRLRDGVRAVGRRALLQSALRPSERRPSTHGPSAPPTPIAAASIPAASIPSMAGVDARSHATAGAGPAEVPSSEYDESDEALEAHQLAVALARDGLRALSGLPCPAEPPGRPPSARELARLIDGEAEPFEAASIARRVRRSPRAQAELGWALRLDRPDASKSVRLAAEDGDAMRDPALGRVVSVVLDPDDGSSVAEVVAFADGRFAVYAEHGRPIRVEGRALRTESMQSGYWLGREARAEDGDPSSSETLEGVLLMEGRAFPLRLPRLG